MKDQRFFPLWMVWWRQKLQNTKLYPYDTFFSELRSCNPLEVDHTEYVNLLTNGMTADQVVTKLKLPKPPPTGIESYKYLQKIWKQEQMSTFRGSLPWFNQKDVVPSLEKMQKIIAFYNGKNIDMLKLGCIFPSLAYAFLPKSTDANFYPFTEKDKDWLDKIREEVFGGPDIVFTRKAVVDETFFRESVNICKSMVGIDARQFYPYSMCQHMPTGLYTRWDLDPETSRFAPRQNKTRSFENMFITFSRRQRHESVIERFLTTGRQKKKNCFCVDWFCSHCNPLIEAMPCFYHFCPCQEVRPSLTEENIQRGTKKKDLQALRRDYFQEKRFTVIETWEWNGAVCTRQIMQWNSIFGKGSPTDVRSQIFSSWMQ